MEDQAPYGVERNELSRVRKVRESTVTALEEIDRVVLLLHDLPDNTGELALAGSARMALNALLRSFSLRGDVKARGVLRER